MNILIVANHYAVCSARYMTDAFRRLGYTVRHVGPAMGRSIWGLTLPPGYEWTPDYTEVEIEYYEPNSDPINHPWNFEPDLTIVMDSDPAILDLPGLERIRKLNGTPVIVYGVDNHVRDYRRPWFDQYFLAHRHVSVMNWQGYLMMDGNFETATKSWYADKEDLTHLPCAYDPTLHTPSPIAWADREYDVCCLGVMYPRRVELVKALKAAGYKVLFGTGLVGEKYVQAHQNSRIALCASFNGDVAQRVFESAAMGNLVLTDSCPDFALLKPDGFYLPDDGDMLTPENAVKAVKAILEYPDGAKAAIANALAWVMPHSWDERARAIVEWYQNQQSGAERVMREVFSLAGIPIIKGYPDTTVSATGEVWGAVNAESGPDNTLPPVDTLGSTLADDATLTSQEGDE